MATKNASRFRHSYFENVEPFASKKTVNVIIETPKGKRNKFDFDPKVRMFFKSYNEAQGREFDLLAAKGPQAARKLLNKTMRKTKSRTSSKRRRAK